MFYICINDDEKMRKIIIGILLVLLVGSITLGGVYSADCVQDITTPYNTTCKLNIGSGLNPDETTVTEEGQILAFECGYYQGYFISTSKDNAADLISNIESTGTKCVKDGVTWYHMKDQHLANSYSVFGGTHLKLESNDYDIGFMENPNSDEVIILLGPSTRIIECFNSIQWG